jgi:hypothetical protein
MADLPDNAITWTLPPTAPPRDVLELTFDELPDAYRDALADRATYRLLALEALTALYVVTNERDALRKVVKTQRDEIAALMGTAARRRR